MGILGPEIAAAVFDTVEKAEEGWALLNDAEIPATVITDPGMLGKFSVSLLVQRDDLERAQEILTPLMSRPPD